MRYPVPVSYTHLDVYKRQVYPARDQAHKRMMEALDKGETLPFALEGSAIYYVGPTPERPGEVIGSAGPTTSGRMDAMSPRLLDLGNKIMIGKGKRDAAVKDAVVRNGAVYLAALGGAGALMAKSVQTLEVIAWPDLGCEAVRRLIVKDMPLTVDRKSTRLNSSHSDRSRMPSAA